MATKTRKSDRPRYELGDFRHLREHHRERRQEGGSVTLITAISAVAKLQGVSVLAAVKVHWSAGRPEEVADAIVCLAGNGYITGKVLGIDGGMA